MEPITVNLPDLSAFGPHGYMVGHIVAALIFGAYAFRQIALAGRCKGNSCNDRSDSQTQEQRSQAVVGDSHIWRGAITGIIGIANVILVLVMSGHMFFEALNKANPTTSSVTASSPQSTLCSCYPVEPITLGEEG